LCKGENDPLTLSKVLQVNNEESLTVNFVVAKTVVKKGEKSSLDTSESSKMKSLTRFKCLECDDHFPLKTEEDIEKICNHIAVGLIGSNLSSFSTFYQSCKFRVKLVVKPVKTIHNSADLEVTAEAMVACTNCNKSTFSLSESGMQNLAHHLEQCHQKRSNFCFFCDRQVSNLKSHLEGFKELHLKRVKALSVCFCKEKLKELSQCQHPFVQCTVCRSSVEHSDPRLPHWMTSTTCDSCISSMLSRDFKDSKKCIIFCKFCQQGQFGHILDQKMDSSSVCVKCLKVLKTFHELRSGKECNNYVKGMLNELVSTFFHCQKDRLFFLAFNN